MSSISTTGVLVSVVTYNPDIVSFVNDLLDNIEDPRI
jgi:hypothetical protein